MGCGTSFVKYVLFFFNLVVAYWVDYKGKLKRKCAGIGRAQSSTGGGPAAIELTLSDIEKKYLGILSNDYGLGLPGIQVDPFDIEITDLLGLAVIGIGVAFQLNWTTIKDELKSHMTVAPWVFIIIGAVMFVIAFFGCCGAIRESHCMVVTYAIFLLVIIIVQVVIAVLLFAYGDTIKEGLVKSVNSLFDKRSSSDVDKPTESVINNIQQQFECCGKNGPQDYGVTLSLPDSCCTTISTIGNVFGGKCTLEAANPGCASTIGKFYEKWNKPIAGAAIGIACIEVVGALFALCLANSIRNMDRRSRY